ncbi:MAG: archaeosortase/exosortase family protein [Nitrososphaerota archaeon]|nr:exosortase/archaeosortase family protein [Candidatus Bathyarchaeota archaeon]MDW8194093.1 archaeosortase/exosortase family protein [Nitrososphaerota archaeon]
MLERSRQAVRIILWISASLAISLLLYWRYVAALLQNIGEIVPGETQLYPIAGIVFVGAFILFRRGEIRRSLEKEAESRSEAKVRLAGLLLALTPALAYIVIPVDMDVSASVLAIVWFGVFAAINPRSSRILASYTVLYVAATLSPKIIYPVAGEPLADFASLIVGHVIRALGIPVLQFGRSFAFTSLNGEAVRFTISPDCSSISSITVFLLLCGLMHLDMKKRASATIMLAAAGTAALTLLNALRIVILLWVGYVGGDWTLWNVHGWLGYAIMIGFYALAAKIYLSLGEPKPATLQALKFKQT